MRFGLGRIGILFTVMVIALSGIGGAFAAWTDKVEIAGTVQTGKLSMGIEKIAVSFVDDAPDNDKKDVAISEHGFEGEALWKWDAFMGSDVPYYSKAVVTINNAYPGLVGTIMYTVGNLGTIPLRISDISFEISDGDGPLHFEWVVPPQSPNANPWGKVFDERGDPDGHVMNIGLNKLVGDQLHACQTLTSEWRVNIRQPAKQDHTYTIVATVEAIQWNKY